MLPIAWAAVFCAYRTTPQGGLTSSFVTQACTTVSATSAVPTVSQPKSSTNRLSSGDKYPSGPASKSWHNGSYEASGRAEVAGKSEICSSPLMYEIAFMAQPLPDCGWWDPLASL